MKAIVSLEQRFYEHKGEWYTSGAFGEAFWERYLEVFSDVLVVARAKKIKALKKGLVRCTNKRVRPYKLPYYIGIKEAVLKRAATKRRLKKLVAHEKGAFILRVGSPIADILAPMLKKAEIDYAVEVVGDPWDVFAPGAIQHPFRPFLRKYFFKKLKRQCAEAKFASYVTEFALQKRYPPKRAIATTHASSIDLGPEHFLRRTEFSNKRIRNFVYVGTLEQLQKAPDILIKAFAKALEKEPDLKLGLIGDGRERAYLEKMASDMGISSSVKFYGHFKGPDEVRKALKDADVFALPSRGEGLPRAMIEAMAYSLVCIGSDIGGIREQIPDEWTAPVGDVNALSELITKASLLTGQEIQKISQRNYKEAKKYMREKVGKRRTDFYQLFKKHLEDVK